MSRLDKSHHPVRNSFPKKDVSRHVLVCRYIYFEMGVPFVPTNDITASIDTQCVSRASTDPINATYRSHPDSHDNLLLFYQQQLVVLEGDDTMAKD
jgi:hypothetical protein